MTFRLMAFGLMCCVLAASSSAQTLKETDQGRIEFQSFTPKTMFDLARERRQNWAEQKVWGELTFPPNTSGKVPVVVLSHGSGGVDRWLQQWVAAFNEIGVATFVVDSFAPRGVMRTIEDQSLVPSSANLMDAFRALEVLATHPRIDAAHIGEMGFSRGGEVAFRTAVEPFRHAVIKSDLKFAFHIPVYPGCNLVYWSDKLTKVPMLNLIGAADDYTHPEPCEALAQHYADAGVPITTIKYADAHHAWDSLVPVNYLPQATSVYNCGVLRWDIDTWKVTAEKTGAVIPLDKLDAYIDACTTRGAHVGRNEKAFQQSRHDVQEFVRRLLKYPIR